MTRLAKARTGSWRGEKMRLVCPNCGAQYEVDERVIPDGGRDVQCSNCGHAWFQQHGATADGPDADAPEQDVAEADFQAESAPAPQVDPEPEPEPEGEGEPEPAAESEPESEVAHEAESAQEEDSESAPEPEPEPTPRELDEDVRNILREEAERELAAREGDVRHDPQELETQEDLGLVGTDDGEAPAASGARARMARLRGLDDGDDGEATIDKGARRELLPDIEEINSSLTSLGDDAEDDFADTATGARRSGFGRGFGTILLIAVLGIALYIAAPKLGQIIPAAEPYLNAYTGVVDGLRARLDGLMQSATQGMQGGEN